MTPIRKAHYKRPAYTYSHFLKPAASNTSRIEAVAKYEDNDAAVALICLAIAMCFTLVLAIADRRGYLD